MLGRILDHGNVIYAEPREVLTGYGRERRVALDRYHLREASRESCGIDPQTARKIEHATAAERLARGAGLARRLLEGQRRQDAAGAIHSGQLLARPLQVLDLRSHPRGMGYAAVESDVSGSAVEVILDGTAHRLREQHIKIGHSHHIAAKLPFFFDPHSNRAE